MYILLSGQPPFSGLNEHEIISKVITEDVEFRPEDWDCVSSQALDLVKSMLTKDPLQRPTFEDIIEHPWLSLIPNETVNPSCLKKLTAFYAQSKLEKATLAFISSQLLEQTELNELNKMFQQIDINKDGKLSREELKIGFAKYNIPINIDELMAKCDIDGNGFIEYNEFLLASMDRSKAMSRVKLYEAFKAYDANVDGVISFEEIQSALGADDNLSLIHI